jgi:hypothetical protein
MRATMKYFLFVLMLVATPLMAADSTFTVSTTNAETDSALVRAKRYLAATAATSSFLTAVDSATGFLSIGDAASTYLTQAASTVDSATASLTTNRNTTQMKADTSAIFAFGGGGGNAGDTTAFTTSTIYGSFFNKGTDTLYVTSLYCVMRHGIGLDTIDVQVLWDDTLGTANATKLNTAAFPVNSVGGILNGVEDASFANSKIPPGNWVWCTTPTGITAGRKPTYLSATISGYRGK